MTLAQLRYRHGKITQKQLSTFLHVDRSAISKWESGKQSPDRAMVMRMAEIFQVPFAEIDKSFIKRNVVNQPRLNGQIVGQLYIDELAEENGLCQ